jgi:hypothetical protein
MPPPAKRAKASKQTDVAAAAPSSSAQTQSSSHRTTKNITITLPSELLLEIVSYFPNISIIDILDNPPTLSVEYRERFASLRALSQTCKELRAALCLPLAWERLEACTTTGALRFGRCVCASLFTRLASLAV